MSQPLPPPGWGPPQGAWPGYSPAFSDPGLLAPRSAARSPLVLAVVALSALLGGVVAGFLVAIVAFTAGNPGWAMSAGMDPVLDEGYLESVQQFPAVPPGELGPDPVLDDYADACFAGDLQACDDLLFQSPPLSEYEDYGATCGGRVKAFDVISCTDLE